MGLGAVAEHLYSVGFCNARPSQYYALAVGPDDECRILSGDLLMLFDGKLSGEEESDYFYTEFNSIVPELPRVERAAAEIPKYVLAVMQLERWHMRARVGEQLRIVESGDSVWEVQPEEDVREGRKLCRRELRALHESGVTAVAPGLYQGRMYVWSTTNGALWSVSYLYWADGRVAVEREDVAIRIGRYRKVERIDIF